MRSLEDQLRLVIKHELDTCNGVNTPKVCERIRTLGGYRSMEDAIIKIILHDAITPGAAIAQIEMELP